MSWKEFMESDEFVAKWLEGRPVSTQKHWSPYVKRFCESVGVSPKDFVCLDMKDARRLVWRFVEPISRQFPSKAIGVRVALQSLYRYATEGDVLTFDSRRGGAHYIRYVRNGNGYIPKLREVYRVADCAGSLKGTAIVLVLFQSGIRPNALCGLNYFHVREQLEAGKVPLRLKITPNVDSKLLSYELEYYYTWLQGEAVQALKAWVDYEMEKKGWKDDMPLFHSCHGRRYESRELFYMARRWIHKAGLNTRRTSIKYFRKSFWNVLVKTPMDDPDFKEALMGHKLRGSRGNYFDYHDLETLEREYMRANFGRYVAKSELSVLREVNVGLEKRVEDLEKAMRDAHLLREK